MRRASIDAAVSVVVLVLLFAEFIAFPWTLSWLPDVWARLGATSELIFAALVIAVVVGWLLSFLPVRWPLLVLRSIPFFWLALALMFLGVLGFPHPFGFGSLLPPIALSLFALPNVAAFDFKQRGMVLIVAALQCIVARLPQLIAADLIVEAFYAWPGEGRAFFSAIQLGLPERQKLDEDIAIVLIASLVVIMLRWSVALLVARIPAKTAS